jgi:hypothetical protein
MSHMTNLSDIEIAKSMETGNLIRKNKWFGVFDRIGSAIIFIALMFYSSLMFLQINFEDPKDRASFLTILSPLVFLFSLYGLFRTIIENRLTCIETSFGQSKNHDLLCRFLKEFHTIFFRSQMK